jgi:hypothetical protein
MLKAEYVVLVSVRFDCKFSDWHGGSYDHYPTEDEIESCIDKILDEYKDNIHFSGVLYTRVEKRYKQVRASLT